MSENAQVTFTIGPSSTGGETVDIVFPYSAFDLQVTYPIVANPNMSYYFPLMKAANDTQYTLGRTFLQEAYLIADYERQNFSVSACSWEQDKISTQNIIRIVSPTKYLSSAESPPALTPKTSPFHLTIADIAGITVGGVSFIAILALAFFYYRRQKKQALIRQAALEAEAAAKAKAARLEEESAQMAKIDLGHGLLHEMTGQQLRRWELDETGRSDPNQYGYSEMSVAEFYNRGSKIPPHATEIGGTIPIYEMPGSEVHEMPARRSRIVSRIASRLDGFF